MGSRAAEDAWRSGAVGNGGGAQDRGSAGRRATLLDAGRLLYGPWRAPEAALSGGERRDRRDEVGPSRRHIPERNARREIGNAGGRAEPPLEGALLRSLSLGVDTAKR